KPRLVDLNPLIHHTYTSFGSRTMSFSRSIAKTAALLAAGALLLSGCVSAEGASGDDKTLTVDFATYNPLSLVIKEKGWLEEELEDVEGEWIESAGSNKANEGLRSEALDIGSTARSAALLTRAHATPIKTISLYGQPECSALVVVATPISPRYPPWKVSLSPLPRALSLTSF